MHNSLKSLKNEMDASIAISAEPASKIAHHKNIILIIKTLISVALMYWVLKGTDLNLIFNSISHSNITFVVLAFSLHLLGYYLSALRWNVLHKIQNVDTSLWYLVKSTMVARFFNNILPSTIGGDAIRAYDSYRVGRSKSKAVTVVFVDRLLGLFALMLYALIAVILAPSINYKIPFLYLWVVIGFIFIGAVVWIIFYPFKIVIGFLRRVSIPFSAKLQRMLEKTVNAFEIFRGEKKVLLNALGISILIQAKVITYYFLISLSLDFSIPYFNFFLIVSLASFIMLLPISINGIGLRENIFVFLLATFSVAKPDAIAFAWIIYGLIIIQGLIGGVIYAFRK